MSKPTRPLGVTLVALLWAIDAVLLLLAAFQMRFGTVSLYGLPQSVVAEQARLAPFVALWGIICGIIGLGLWTIQNWARILTIICCILSFLVAAVLFFIYLAAAGINWALVIPMALDACIVSYLMSPAVVKVFHEAW